MALAFHRPGFGCSYGQYGDDLGNIERLIDLNLKALDNAFPDAKRVEFDVGSGSFRNAETGAGIRTELLERRLGRLRSDRASPASLAAAGSKTFARGAVWRALLREAGSTG